MKTMINTRSLHYLGIEAHNDNIDDDPLVKGYRRFLYPYHFYSHRREDEPGTCVTSTIYTLFHNIRKDRVCIKGPDLYPTEPLSEMRMYNYDVMLLPRHKFHCGSRLTAERNDMPEVLYRYRH